MTMTQPLSRTTLPTAVLGAAAPPEPGILHLGIGNFHRAHAAVYTARAMAAKGGDWGIVAVAKERRSALITAAVTGQIDVRGEVA